MTIAAGNMVGDTTKAGGESVGIKQQNQTEQHELKK
jgi:hypothetical protein